MFVIISVSQNLIVLVKKNKTPNAKRIVMAYFSIFLLLRCEKAQEIRFRGETVSVEVFVILIKDLTLWSENVWLQFSILTRCRPRDRPCWVNRSRALFSD